MAPSAVNVDRIFVEKYSRMLVTVCITRKGQIFKFLSNICQPQSRSEFVKNNYEEKECWKLGKSYIFTDIFYRFEPPGNLIKWFDLRIQVFR